MCYAFADGAGPPNDAIPDLRQDRRRQVDAGATACVTCTGALDQRRSLDVEFAGDLKTIEDYGRLSARLRAAMGPHVVDILRQGLSVVLDFPANTVKNRDWMRALPETRRINLAIRDRL